jgi:chromosome segregation ATPase
MRSSASTENSLVCQRELARKPDSNSPTGQEERLEELRDIHHMETKSQTELIDKLRQQAEDAEVNVKTHKASVAKAEEDAAKHKLQVERLQAELQKATRSAKDEQEKTGKAVTLLKTVRGKLIKTEKERDDAVKDAGAGRQKLQEELDKERAEKAQVLADVARVNAERDNALAGMKSHFDREIAGLKERQQRETAAIKAQFELEAMNARVSVMSLHAEVFLIVIRLHL